jgi:hypothetical protein
MQKFTEFVKEHNALVENQKRDSINAEFTSLYEAKLKELGVKSPMELSEEELDAFNSYVKTIKEDLSKKDKKASIKEGEVTDEKSFREYAEGVLKKAHGDDYDEKIAKKVIDGLISKVGKDGDWGQAVGRLTSGLGG